MQHYKHQQHGLCQLRLPAIAVPASTDVTGSIGVLCPGLIDILSAAAGSADTSVAVRDVASGLNKLGFSLYTDNTMATKWGDGTLLTGVLSATGANTGETFLPFAELTAAQVPVVGGNYGHDHSVAPSRRSVMCRVKRIAATAVFAFSAAGMAHAQSLRVPRNDLSAGVRE